MRDPERIPTILAALERRWREDPDLRLGELVVDALRSERVPLGHVEDARLLEGLGIETETKAGFVHEEPCNPEMRDLDRIPMIVAAIERRWREDPGVRLGELFVDALECESILPEHLGLVEDVRLLEGLGIETDAEAQFVQEEPGSARERSKTWLRSLPDAEAARIRPVAELFCGCVDYLLLFAPVDLALEFVAIHDALERATTWRDVKQSLSAERLAELVDWTVAGGETPADDEPFEVSEPWPQLRYSEIPNWLPPDVVYGFGESFNGLDSGTNFETEREDYIIEALERAGVTVRTDGPDLADLFEPM